jgi:hypothetical protein
MTAKELYELEDFGDFICEFEDKWQQYAAESNKVKAYFGSVDNGLALFEKEKANAFSEIFRMV